MLNATYTVPAVTIEPAVAYRVSCECGWWTTKATKAAAQHVADDHRYASRCSFCGIAQDDHSSLRVSVHAGDLLAREGLAVFCPDCVLV